MYIKPSYGSKRLERKADFLIKRTETKKLAKRSKKGKIEIEEARKAFSDVRCFTPIHWRIRGVLDVWPTTGKYWSPVNGRKGVFSELADLMDVVDRAERDKDESEEWNTYRKFLPRSSIL